MWNGFKLHYKGDIDMKVSNGLLYISATSAEPDKDMLYTWDCRVFDVLILADVKYIHHEPRPNN